MWPNPQETEYLVTLTEETLNGNLHFFVQWWEKERNNKWMFCEMGTIFKSEL